MASASCISSTQSRGCAGGPPHSWRVAIRVQHLSLPRGKCPGTGTPLLKSHHQKVLRIPAVPQNWELNVGHYYSKHGSAFSKFHCTDEVDPLRSMKLFLKCLMHTHPHTQKCHVQHTAALPVLSLYPEILCDNKIKDTDKTLGQRQLSNNHDFYIFHQ